MSEVFAIIIGLSLGLLIILANEKLTPPKQKF